MRRRISWLCLIEGCDRPATTFVYCAEHYKQWRKLGRRLPHRARRVSAAKLPPLPLPPVAALAVHGPEPESSRAGPVAREVADASPGLERPVVTVDPAPALSAEMSEEEELVRLAKLIFGPGAVSPTARVPERPVSARLERSPGVRVKSGR